MAVEHRHRRADGLRQHQRLIALDIDDDLAPQGRGHLGETIRARQMVGARHHRRAAKTVHGIRDSLVVGCDDDGVDRRRVGRTAVDVFDHRAARDERERLPRKTSRVVPRGNDGDDASGLECRCQPWWENYGHGRY
jgi:hypothetical protein